MRRVEFAPCLPTRGISVPAGQDWIHEIKHDGYRITVHREDKRVRLFTRNGHDWTDRYPLIVEAALRVRIGSFVMDGEAVLLGADGRSDFDGFHSRQHNDEVRDCWRVASTEYSCQILNVARSGRTCSAMPASWGWRAWSLNATIALIARAFRPIG